ncbi:MAG: flippase-like domain-containing protein [Candidatus Competibacteraceae bacterium]|nr:flippase-like domain-containing protein [Candidatus Competibacteraceae bacterium]
MKKLRVAFGIVLLAWLIGYLDISSILKQLANLNPVFVAAAVLLILMTTCLGASNTFLLVNLEGQLSLTAFLPAYWASWAVGLIFPGQVGDIATLSAILKRRGLMLSQTLGRSLADKLISFALMLSFAFFGIFALPGVSLTGYWPLITLTPVAFSLIYWRRTPLLYTLNRWQPRLMDFLSQTFREILHLARHHSVRIVINISLTVLKISLAGAAYWCIFRALGYIDVALWRVIPLVAASSLVAYLPISFNGLGTVEIAGVALFSAIGINESSVLSAYLTLRIIVLTLAWLPVGLWLTLGQQSHR